MAYLNSIATFINEQIKISALSSANAQPAKLFGISSVMPRKKKDTTDLELLPSIITNGKATLITPESNTSIILYHKVLSQTYNYERKSHGDGYDLNAIAEMQLLVINNMKITKATNEMLEPALVFSFPQRVSGPLQAELELNKSLITPLSSTLDQLSVFRQEYPRSDYFLNEMMGLFAIRYRVAVSISQACINKCLCNQPTTT